jgi:Ca2+-binding EF-hand superfamily protein
MTKSLFIAAAAVAALATQAEAQAPAQAQAAPQTAAQTAPQSGLRGNWLQADTTRQQAQQRADMLFQKLDTNRDGTLTRTEAEQATAQMGGKGKGARGGRMLERLFDKSATVTQAQFQAQSLSRFERQDLNHDGVVTADERQQARASRSQGN